MISIKEALMVEFKNINEYQRYIVEKYADRVAYRFLHGNIIREITYKNFVGKTEGIAKELKDLGAKRSKIAIIGKTSYEWFAIYLGILASDNIVVSMDAKLMQNQKEDILKEADVDYVFYDGLTDVELEGLRNQCKTVKQLYDMKTFVRNVEPQPLPKDDRAALDETAQYMFTSGTTGESKAVIITNRNVLSVINFQNMNPFEEKGIFLSVLSIHHCYELSCHLSALENGYTICINDKIESIVENIKRFQPDLICLVPAILEEILRKLKDWIKTEGISSLEGTMPEEVKKHFESIYGSNVKRIVCGGAPLRSELSREASYFGILPAHGYGMTEMCGHTTMNMNTLEKPDSVGIPFRKDVHIKIAVDGEILVKGPNLMKGYLNQDSSSLYTDDGYFKTGDLGRMDEDGYLYITGRKKNVIILSNGENIYPEELEIYVSALPGVRQAVVFQWENQIAAMFYTGEFADTSKIEQAVQELNRKLAAYKRITKIFYRHTPFSVTPSGKIRRNEFLKEISQKGESLLTTPVTKAEHFLSDVVKEVLGLSFELSVNDNIFSLGGNSLSALAIATKTNLNAQVIYEHPVIRDLAKVLENESNQTFQDETYVNQFIQYNQNIENKEPVEGILLTGATGFLGAHILYELIHRKNATVYCISRIRGRLGHIYYQYFKEELPEIVHEIIGDIAKENIGLSKKLYKELTKCVNTVIHAAANVRHVGDRQQFMETNFNGTERMIQFCKKSNAILHFVSSYVSSGIAIVPIHSDVELFDEQTLYIGQDYAQNVYVQTKYLAEKKILEEREQGLRANIYRVGCLTSRRRDGVFQLNAEESGLRNRLIGVLKAGVYTEDIQAFPVDFTAVDECAEAFITLIYSGRCNNIYHMFNPNAITIKDLGWIGGKNLRKVSNIKFAQIMKEHVEDKQISEYAFYSAMSTKSKAVFIQCAETYRELTKLSFRWGINTIDYIREFLLLA